MSHLKKKEIVLMMELLNQVTYIVLILVLLKFNFST